MCRLAMEEGQFPKFRDKIEIYQSEKQEQSLQTMEKNPKEVGQLQRGPPCGLPRPLMFRRVAKYGSPRRETTSECHSHVRSDLNKTKVKKSLANQD